MFYQQNSSSENSIDKGTMQFEKKLYTQIMLCEKMLLTFSNDHQTNVSDTD